MLLPPVFRHISKLYFRERLTPMQKEQYFEYMHKHVFSYARGYDPYGALYAGIQRANLVIKNIDKIPAAGISEEDRSMIKG